MAGGAPPQWRVMIFRTAGTPPAHDYERRATGVARPQQRCAPSTGTCASDSVLPELGAELLDAPATLAQARHVGGIGNAEVGAHAVGRALHSGDVFFLQQPRHEIG